MAITSSNVIKINSVSSTGEYTSTTATNYESVHRWGTSSGNYYRAGVVQGAIGSAFQNNTGMAITITGLKAYTSNNTLTVNGSTIQSESAAKPFISTNISGTTASSLVFGNSTTLSSDGYHTFTFSSPITVTSGSYFVMGLASTDSSSSTAIHIGATRSGENSAITATNSNLWYLDTGGNSPSQVNQETTTFSGYYWKLDVAPICQAAFVETNDASIGGAIYWQDENGNYISYPQSIYVSLYRDGVDTGLKDGGGSGWAFRDLTVYSNLSTGTKYVYTASFPEVEGYSKSVSADGLNVTYRRISPELEQEYITISGTVNWVGGVRRAMAQILRDDRLHMIFNLYDDKDNIPSTYTYKQKVPVYSNLSTGAKYTYKLIFSDVDGFTKTMVSNSTNGYDVTYTLIDEGNKSYIYTGGTWREAETYIYTNGSWQEVEPNVF